MLLEVDQAVAIPQACINGQDAAGQRETGEYLVRGLDEDWLSHRKLFPPECEARTW
jgi:hypothetical protein